MKWFKYATFLLLCLLIFWITLAIAAQPGSTAGRSIDDGTTILILILSFLLLLGIWQIKFIPENKKDLLWPLAILLLLLNTLFTIASWSKEYHSNMSGNEYATFTTVQSPKPGGLNLQPLMDSCEYCILKTDEPKAFKNLQTSTSQYQMKEIDISASVSYSLKDCRFIFQTLKLNDWEVFQIDTSKDSLRTTYHLKRPVIKKKWWSESSMLIPISEEYYYQEDFFDPNSYFKEFIETLRLAPENFPTNEYLEADPIPPNPPDMDKYIYERWTGRTREEIINIKLTPNYAGHLHAFVTGCGTNCKTLNFIDLRNGKHLESLTINFSCGMSEDAPLDTYYPIHTIDSRLLVVPCITNSDGEGFHYYEYINDTLVKLKSEKWNTDWNNRK